jgi:primary-amine oxidase
MNSTARYIGNKEPIGNGSDTVVWYRQSYHHLARSDDKVRLGTVWSSFQLVPRDWHSQNQF